MNGEIGYSFSSRVLTEEAGLAVIDFHGEQTLSRPYRYVINLKSINPDMDIDFFGQTPCTFTIHVGDESYPVHGVVAEFEQYHQVGDDVLYRAVLVPRLWLLSLYQTNEVYLDKSVSDIIEMVLQEGQLSSLDYELRLQQELSVWEYRCQFGESHLDFISRLMEREGIYYYFEQTEEAEVLIITDHAGSHDLMPDPEVMYAPPTGLDQDSTDHVHSLVCRTKRMPREVVLRDFSYQKPSLDVTGKAVVDGNGIGEVYVYGDNFETPEEGSRLAQVRAQEILCGNERFHGDGTVARMTSGFQFTLGNHYRGSFMQDYLVVSIEHEGTNPSFMTPGADSLEGQTQAGYHNSFTAIPASVQFRPPRETEKARFYGTLSARIDAEGDGTYAEVDDQGRYRVILPFDRVLRDEGKASHWLRMQQPFAGADEGMNFPLRKGTEVLLTFIDGDPDRPVISGAVPNGASPSVVNDSNQTNNVIKTSSGNKIEMEDQDGANRIKFQTGDNKTYMHMGAPNHDGDGWVIITEGMERKEIQGGQQLTVMAAPLASGEEARTIAETGEDFNDLTTSNLEAFNEVASVPDGTGLKIFEFPAVTGSVTGAWQYRVGTTGTWTALSNTAQFSTTNWFYMTQDYEVRFCPDATNKVSGSVSFKYMEVPEPTPSAIGSPVTYGFGTSSQTKTVSVPQYPHDSNCAEGIAAGAFTESFVAITSNSETSNGKWQCTVDQSTSSSIAWEDYANASISSSNTLFLMEGNQMQFVPYPASPGDKTLHVWLPDSDGHVESWALCTVPTDSCAAVEKDITEETTVYLANAYPYPSGGYVQYKRSGGSWTSVPHGSSTVTLYSGDQLRFVPAATVCTPAITYLSGLSGGAHTTTLDTTGFKTETLSIDQDDLIDEQDIHQFTKMDHEGQPNSTTCTTTSFTATNETTATAAMTQCDELSGNYIISRQWGDQYHYVRGDTFQYNDGDAREYHFRNRFEVNVSPPQSTGSASAPAYYDGFASTDLSGLIDKMKTIGFGDTVPTGVKTYSQAAVSGTSDLEKWRTLLENGHVIINHRDEFKTHEGNLYDFGGYWNYNLGNSYAENHLNQGAELNKRHNNLTKGGKDVFNGGGSFSGDVIAGPNSGDISAKGHVTTTTNDAQVEKSFTDSYSFTMGCNANQPANQLEITWANTESHTAGNSYDYNYGGEHQETNYDGAGTERHWERSGGGTWENKDWNKQGALIHHEVGNSNFGKSAAIFDFGHSNEVSFNAAATSKLSVNTGLSIDIAAKAAAVIDLEASAAFTIKGEIGAGITMLFTGTDKFQMDMPMTEVAKEKAFKAEVQTMMIGNMATQMKNEGIELKSGSLTFKNEPIDMEVGMEFNL